VAVQVRASIAAAVSEFEINRQVAAPGGTVVREPWRQLRFLEQLLN